MDFCELAKQGGAVGPYGIRLSHKIYETLGASHLKHHLVSHINWVGDALRVVIRQMLSAEGRVSDYLMMTYPESFSESQRRTESRDQRHTLLYRLRLLLRCMMRAPSHYRTVGHDAYSSLRTELDVMVECVRQAVGGAAYERLRESVERFNRLWFETDPDKADDRRVVEELQYLLDEDVMAVFESLRVAFCNKESEREQAESVRDAERERMASELRRLSEAQEASNRETRSLRLLCNRLVAEGSAGDADDPYSRLAGLDRIRGAKRTELLACISCSHERFAIRRGDKSGDHTLTHLAEVVWREHREEFEAYARLAEDPGYKNVRSLAAKLYKLAAKYPEADHFRWE